MCLKLYFIYDEFRSTNSLLLRGKSFNTHASTLVVYSFPWPGNLSWLLSAVTKPITLSIAEIIFVKNVGAIVVCGFFMKWLIKDTLKVWEKSWEPFGSYLLNSTFNPNWARLAVLFSRQLLNGFQYFFVLTFSFSLHFIENSNYWRENLLEVIRQNI